MIIPAYRLGFSLELELGEFTVRTRKRYYSAAFAVVVHLHGYPVTGYPGIRNRFAFAQFGDRTFWLRRY